MESTALLLAKHTLAAIGIILAAGTVSSFLASKLRIPDVAIFLLIGILLGPNCLGWIHIAADSTINQLILIFGSSYILFDGGASLKLNVLKGVWITITTISTLGVLLTAALTAWLASQLLHIPYLLALLLGSVIASTDPATLVPVFKQIKVKARVAQTVMSESAFNDAMGAILTFTVLALIQGTSSFSLSNTLSALGWQILFGIVTGAALGYAAIILIAHTKYAFLAEHAPTVTLMAVLAAYLGADGFQASGFMAVFVFGMMIGNKETFGFSMSATDHEKLDDFVITTAFIMRTFIFILLGSQVDFSLIQQYWQPGLIIVFAFMLLIRPITVFICAGIDRRANWTLNELLFMSWTRETGVIPGALAGMLIGLKIEGANMIASITLMTILMTILLQATTTRWVANKLGLLEK